MRAVGYDAARSVLIIESVDGIITPYAPVPYDRYYAIASSRFPERIYRHRISEKILPAPLPS